MQLQTLFSQHEVRTVGFSGGGWPHQQHVHYVPDIRLDVQDKQQRFSLFKLSLVQVHRGVPACSSHLSLVSPSLHHSSSDEASCRVLE